MNRHTEPDPTERRAAAEYRFALITRDYRRLGPVPASWWGRHRRAVRRVD